VVPSKRYILFIDRAFENESNVGGRPNQHAGELWRDLAFHVMESSFTSETSCLAYLPVYRYEFN
jgi:hypothetical protein